MHPGASFTLCQAYWAERPELFSQIADAQGEEARSLAVLKWFIVSTLPRYLFHAVFYDVIEHFKRTIYLSQ